MKIVADNHAETRLYGTGARPETRTSLLLASIGDDLRTLYDAVQGAAPDHLIDLALRLDRRTAPATEAA